MLHIRFVLIALSLILQPSIFAKSVRNITVMLSNSENHANQAFERLERNIIEQFSRTLNLRVEYIMANEVLNVAFNSEDDFRKFRQSIEKL